MPVGISRGHRSTEGTCLTDQGLDGAPATSYSQIEERRCVLRDALLRDGHRESALAGERLLPAIDRLKAQLVEPKDAKRRIEAASGKLVIE